MEVVIERACGMDIHKDNITACIFTSKGKEIQTFSTKTVFLLQLIDWIKQHECTHVAMESTGVFWKPIVNLIEAEGIEFLVVNAQHIIHLYLINEYHTCYVIRPDNLKKPAFHCAQLQKIFY